MSEQTDDTQKKGFPTILRANLSRGAQFMLVRPFLSGVVCAVFAVLLLAITLPEHEPAKVPDTFFDVAVTQAVAVKEADQPKPVESTPATLPEQDVHEMKTTLPVAPDGQPAHVDVPAKAEEAAPEDTAPAATAEVKPVPAPVVPAPVKVKVVADVALLISDVGLNRRVAEAIDKTMPRDASLAISIYGNNPAGTAAAFAETGRDVWMQVAAQSVKGGIDPGPLAVSAGLTAKQDIELMKKQLELIGKSVIGIYLPDDADIPGVPDVWRDTALEVIAENKMVLDGTPTKVATELYIQKSESKISAYLKADVVIDGHETTAVLQKNLADAIPVILNAREAIVVIKNPTVPATQTLEAWIATLAGQGIRLVPASQFTGLKP